MICPLSITENVPPSPTSPYFSYSHNEVRLSVSDHCMTKHDCFMSKQPMTIVYSSVQYSHDIISQWWRDIAVSIWFFSTWLLYANIQTDFLICVVFASGKFWIFVGCFFFCCFFFVDLIHWTKILSVCRYATPIPFFFCSNVNNFYIY